MRPPTIEVTGTIAFDTVATVRRLPGRDETARVEGLRRMPGGAAGNVAKGLARLGLRPRVVAAVGPDFGGSDYERDLRDAGVDLDGLVRSDDVATAHAISASDPDGSQHVYFFPGAAYSLPSTTSAGSDVGHFCAGPLDRYAERMRACRVATLDPGQEVFHRDVADVVRLLPLADVVFLNEFEADRVHKAAGLDAAGILAEGPRVLVVTQGARGQVVHEADGARTHVPVVPANVVEPTGAGDAHRAGYLYATALGASPVDAARVGAVLASFAVAAMGTQAALPTLDEARTRFEKAFGAWPVSDGDA